MGITRFILHLADRLLAPELCPACGTEVTDGRGKLCDFCAGQVRPLPHEGRCSGCGGECGGVTELCGQCAAAGRPWIRGVSAFAYSGNGGELLRRYKYGGRVVLAPFFAAAMAEAWRGHGSPARPELIVPIPRHWTR
ncbi:MAG: hypothetical protein J6S21_04090, partial [Victivallales bacterium]|nr:hypothetical protein [Victivallales bacterium]